MTRSFFALFTEVIIIYGQFQEWVDMMQRIKTLKPDRYLCSIQVPHISLEIKDTEHIIIKNLFFKIFLIKWLRNFKNK